MSSLIKLGPIGKLCLRNRGGAVLVTAVRHHWNKDYKPAPVPQTEQERLKAAAKYNVHPAEYETYPDDGDGVGDYPKLPLIGADSRDPYYPWDNPELKRNFNEPLHVEFDLLREDRYDVSFRPRHPPWVLWAQFLGTLGVLFGIYWLFDQVKMFHSVTPRHYPAPGKKHYTFEVNE